MDLSKAKAIAPLAVSSLDAATVWYRDTLGATPAQTSPAGVQFQCGSGTSFFLYESQFAGTNQATGLMLEVADFDEAFADLQSSGVQFENYDFGEIRTVDGVVTAPDGSRSAWFKDPDGNILAIGNR
jgi:catechol 2,3-dioxygenase-like lactoylglutathione lyase family enzyme